MLFKYKYIHTYILVLVIALVVAVALVVDEKHSILVSTKCAPPVFDQKHTLIPLDGHIELLGYTNIHKCNIFPLENL